MPQHGYSAASGAAVGGAVVVWACVGVGVRYTVAVDAMNPCPLVSWQVMPVRGSVVQVRAPTASERPYGSTFGVGGNSANAAHGLWASSAGVPAAKSISSAGTGRTPGSGADGRSFGRSPSHATVGTVGRPLSVGSSDACLIAQPSFWSGLRK
jgi:hypothetical protein